jgi:hypothetical protein
MESAEDASAVIELFRLQYERYSSRRPTSTVR